MKPRKTIVFHYELDRETDGRWIAEIHDLPGVLAYGTTREEAVEAVRRLAREVIVDRALHGGPVPSDRA